MFLTMAVTLYTSRVVLNVLGVHDFGIFGVIGGFVSLFGFLNAAMSSATQRYLAYDVGKKNWEKLRETFNATFIIHCGIAIIIVIFCETVGLWFLNNRLNIPEDRLLAANIVYHFSVLSSALTITQVPFNALLVVRERMRVFANFSIVEVTLKLLVVYLLSLSTYDKLIFYSVLLFVVTFLITSYYKVYCLRHFEESRFKWYYDKGYYTELLQYSGWNLFGSISTVAKGQGINILLNIFFGTIMNASYTVMLQVQNAVNLFNSNFLTAIRPQIIKKYANGELHAYQKLTMSGSKFSFLLLYMLVLPIIFNIDFILKFWLGDPPDYANIFIILSLINLLIDSLSGTLMTAVQAIGKIKWYQIILGGFVFLNLPISYLVYYFYKIPELSFYVGIILAILSLVFRLLFLKKLIDFDIKCYLIKVIVPILTLVGLWYVATCLKIYNLLSANDFLTFCKSIVLITLFNFMSIVTVALTREERGWLYKSLKKYFRKII